MPIQACNQAQTKSSAKVSCGAEQLCAGLECGIEGSLHTVQEVWPDTDGWEEDIGMAEGATVPSEEEMRVLDDTHAARKVNLWRPADPVATAYDSTRSHYEEETDFGTMLVNAKNAINDLSRYVMLWHYHHAWPRASHFAFN